MQLMKHVGCDLLRNLYLCKVIDNREKERGIKLSVVIC